jgi:hypothetical protein
MAERRANAARNWASLASEVRAMVATDVEVVDLAAAAIPGLEVAELDVDQLNRMLSRGAF